MMKILALEKELPDATEAQLQEHNTAEAVRLWELYQRGVIRELYYRQDCLQVVMVLECEDVAEAEAILHTMPQVEAGLIDFELIPLVPYPGFSRLFAL